MKSPIKSSSASRSAPRDLDIADRLSQLYSDITTLNEKVTETMEQLSTIRSDVACFKDHLELVLTAIERSGSGNNIASQAITDLNRFTQGSLTSARHYQPANRNNLETQTYRSGAPPVAAASPSFGTLAPSPSPFSPSPSPFSPSVNPSPFIGRPAATFHTGNHAASPPAYLNPPPIKTPQQVADDLVPISNTGTFYIITKGRDPGIYTDWPKAEALVRGLKHSVYCKKFDKSDAIRVYEDAYGENRLERVLS